MLKKNIAVDTFVKTVKLHKRLINNRVSSSIGMHRTQHIILMRLASEEKLPSQKELADKLNITPAAVTGMLKKLEAGGYIKRNIGADSRYNEITITAEGRRVVETSRAIFESIDSSIFEGFSDDELDSFIAHLEKIQDNIKREGEIRSEKMV